MAVSKSVDSIDYRFLSIRNISLCQTSDEELNCDVYSNPISVAHKYGKIFIGIKNELVILDSSDVEDTEKNIQDSIIRVPLPSRPLFISLNCDNNTLLVSFLMDSKVRLYLFDTRALLSNDIKPFGEDSVWTTPNTVLRDIAWNPSSPNHFTAVYSNGCLALYTLTGNKLDLTTLPSEEGITCVSWSPKGKQLVVGKKNGTLTQFKPDLKEVRSISGPSVTSSANSIFWISTYVFLVGYLENENLSVVMISSSKGGGSVNYDNLGDITYGSRRIAHYNYLFHHLTNWNCIIAASNASLEVALLEENKNSVWSHVVLENYRAEIPLKDYQTERYTLGMAVNYSSVKILPESKDVKSPQFPMPMLHLLTADGLLCSFYILNLKDGAPHINCKKETMTTDNIRAGVLHLPLSTSSSSSCKKENNIDKVIKVPEEKFHTPIKKKESKPMTSTPKSTPTSTSIVLQSSIKEKEVSESQGVIEALEELMTQFTKEMTSFKISVSHHRRYESIGEENERGEMSKMLEESFKFLQSLSKVLSSQKREISELANSTLEIFEWCEEARSRDIRHHDAKYLNALRRRPLDPRSQKQLESLQNKTFYLEQQLWEANRKLDFDWEAFQSNSILKKSIGSSSKSDVLSLLLNNKRLIEHQNLQLESVAKQMKIMNMTQRRRRERKDDDENEKEGLETKNELNDELNALIDSFKNSSCGNSTHNKKAVISNSLCNVSPIKVFSTSKEEALKRFLAGKERIRVKSCTSSLDSSSLISKDESLISPTKTLLTALNSLPLFSSSNVSTSLSSEPLGKPKSESLFSLSSSLIPSKSDVDATASKSSFSSFNTMNHVDSSRVTYSSNGSSHFHNSKDTTFAQNSIKSSTTSLTNTSSSLLETTSFAPMTTTPSSSLLPSVSSAFGFGVSKGKSSTSTRETESISSSKISVSSMLHSSSSSSTLTPPPTTTKTPSLEFGESVRVISSSSPSIKSNNTISSSFGVVSTPKVSSVLKGSITQSASSPFGVVSNPTDSSSLFGVSSKTTDSSLFGVSTPTPTSFSLGGSTPTTTSSSLAVSGTTTAPVFGGSTTTTSSSIFGVSTPATASSPFSGSSTTTSSSIFGVSTSATASSSFGESTTTKSSSIFGVSTPATASSPFGGSTTTTASSPFGGSATTTSSSIFGVSTTTSSSSIFGVSTPATASSSFGNSTTTISSSIFGVSSPATASSIFGGSTSTSSTSIFGVSTPATASSLFGISTPATASSPFSGSTTTTSSSPFGGSTSTSSTSIFRVSTPATASSPFSGFTPATASSSFSGFTTTTASSPFSGLTTTTASSPFGGVTTTTASSPFGGFTTTTASSVFGGSSTSNPSIFGVTNTANALSPFGASSSPSIFGGANATSSNSSSSISGVSSTPSAFGGAFSNTSSPSSLFGGGSSSIFGGGNKNGVSNAAETSFGNFAGNSSLSTQVPISSSFGISSTTNNNTNATNIFGGGGETSGFFSGLGSKPTPSNDNANKNVFSPSFSTPTTTSNIFGGSGGNAFVTPSVSFSSGFNGSNTSDLTSGFGAPPTFGGGPSFGASTSFGASASFGGFGASLAQAPNFGSSVTEGFGELAAQSNNSNNLFGSPGTFNSPPSFGNTSPGGSSFTSWR